MAIPSFDELLEKARQVGERESERVATERTSQLAAKGLSDLVNTLLFTPHGERKEFAGSVSQEGEFTPFQQPRRTGLTLAEKFFGYKALKPQELPKGSFPITREEAVSNIGKQFLQTQKQLGSERLLRMRLDAMKDRSPILASTQPLSKQTSDYVYGSLGMEPPEDKVLSFGEANLLLRAKGMDTSEFFRDLGIQIQMEKDIFGQISPEKKSEFMNVLEGRKSQSLDFGGTFGGQKIRNVRKVR